MTERPIPRTDERGVPVQERYSDRSRHRKLEAFLEDNWRTIMTLVIAACTWYAANVYGPIKAIPALVQRDSSRAVDHSELFHKIETTDKKVDRMEGAILTLSRISCFSLDVADRAKYDINCKDIPLPERGGTSNR